METAMRIGDRVRVLRFQTMTPAQYSVTGVIEDIVEGQVLLHKLQGTINDVDVRTILPGLAVRPQDILSLEEFAQLN